MNKVAGPAFRKPWFARFCYAPLLFYFAVCAFFLFDIDIPRTEAKALMLWELWYVAAPLALFIFPMAYRHRAYLHRIGNRKKMSAPTVAILFYLFTLVFTFAVPLAVNAFGGSPNAVSLHGLIVQKFITHGRYFRSNYTLVVDEQFRHRLEAFGVSKSMYDDAQIGMSFRETGRIGQLGIFFRWILGSSASSGPSVG